MRSTVPIETRYCPLPLSFPSCRTRHEKTRAAAGHEKPHRNRIAAGVISSGERFWGTPSPSGRVAILIYGNSPPIQLAPDLITRPPKARDGDAAAAFP